MHSFFSSYNWVFSFPTFSPHLQVDKKRKKKERKEKKKKKDDKLGNGEPESGENSPVKESRIPEEKISMQDSSLNVEIPGREEIPEAPFSP